MYKDKDKQREAVKLATRRWRDRRKADRAKGVVARVLKERDGRDGE